MEGKIKDAKNVEEIKRILRPRGRVLLVDWSSGASMMGHLETIIPPNQAREMFEKKGFHVTGIEPDPKNTDLINRELKVGHCVNGFIEDLSLDKKFDVIWLTHVIEHVEKPDLLLKKCHDFYLNYCKSNRINILLNQHKA